MTAEFRVLGPVEIVVDGEPVELAAAKPRALLALLLLRRNRAVSTGELIAELWDDEPPDTAAKALQVYVSQLRKAIGADRLRTKPPGYELRVEEGELDLDRFEELVRDGRELLAAGDAESASERLEEALALWRGPALGDLPVAREAAARLEESRLAALEDRVEADLALGRHAQLVAELDELVAHHPLRERLRGQLMLALYRSGRQADALEAYRRTRELLVGELGIEPGTELRELEGAILRHDPGLDAKRRPVKAGDAATRKRLELRLVAIALVLIAAAVAAVAYAATRSESSPDDIALRAYVGKVENFLAQSSEGRTEIVSTLARQSRCKLAPRAAVASLDRIQRNRQSLLQQVAALAVPPNENALQASSLLQQAIQASISADWHYRDWLQARKRCGPADDSHDLRLALEADGRATDAKRQFVHFFNPLAYRFDKRIWSDTEF